MQQASTDLRTRLAKVRGLGSAKHGVGHWWLERITALLLVPLSLWFLGELVSALLSPNVMVAAEWFSSPVNTVLLCFMIVAMFIHTKLGNQVVIEDYVHSPFMKYALLLLNSLICYLFAVLCLLAVLKLHFLDVVASS